jgi:hypothetical protein
MDMQRRLMALTREFCYDAALPADFKRRLKMAQRLHPMLFATGR